MIFAMNNLKMVFFFNSAGWVFVHKEVRCSSKIEIKVVLQYTNKKLSLSGNIIECNLEF